MRQLGGCGVSSPHVAPDFRNLLTRLAGFEFDFQPSIGSCYLASIVHAFSRRVVGWSMATHMRAELVTSALDAAIVHRRPAGGLVHHSDQGSP